MKKKFLNILLILGIIAGLLCCVVACKDRGEGSYNGNNGDGTIAPGDITGDPTTPPDPTNPDNPTNPTDPPAPNNPPQDNDNNDGKKFHTVVVNNNGNVVERTYEAGTKITLKADGDADKVFVCWLVENAEYSDSPELTYVVEKDVLIKAVYTNFDQIVLETENGEIPDGESTKVLAYGNKEIKTDNYLYVGYKFSLPIPYKRYFTFTGWYSGNTRITDETGVSMIDYDGSILNFTARYRENPYLYIVLDSDNLNIDKRTIKHYFEDGNVDITGLKVNYKKIIEWRTKNLNGTYSVISNQEDFILDITDYKPSATYTFYAHYEEAYKVVVRKGTGTGSYIKDETFLITSIKDTGRSFTYWTLGNFRLGYYADKLCLLLITDENYIYYYYDESQVTKVVTMTLPIDGNGREIDDNFRYAESDNAAIKLVELENILQIATGEGLQGTEEIEKETVISANFTPNIYALTYELNCNVNGILCINDNDRLAILAYGFTETGYNTGIFTKESHKEFKAEMSLDDVPEILHYSFGGWQRKGGGEIPSTMPANDDLVLKGTYIADKHLITVQIRDSEKYKGTVYLEGNINEASYSYGTKISITLKANNGFVPYQLLNIASVNMWTSGDNNTPVKLVNVTKPSGTGVWTYEFEYIVEDRQTFTVNFDEREYTIYYDVTVEYLKVGDVTEDLEYFEGGEVGKNKFDALFKGYTETVKYNATNCNFRYLNYKDSKADDYVDLGLKYGNANWTFSGWSAYDQGLNTLQDFTMPAKDLYVTAKFSINAHRLSLASSSTAGVQVNIREINGNEASNYRIEDSETLEYMVPFGAEITLRVIYPTGYRYGNVEVAGKVIYNSDDGSSTLEGGISFIKDPDSKYIYDLEFALTNVDPPKKEDEVPMAQIRVLAKRNDYTMKYFLNVDYENYDPEMDLYGYIELDLNEEKEEALVVDGVKYYYVDRIIDSSLSDEEQAFAEQKYYYNSDITTHFLDVEKYEYVFGNWKKYISVENENGERIKLGSLVSTKMPDENCCAYGNLVLNRYAFSVGSQTFDFEENPREQIITAIVKETITSGNETDEDKSLVYYTEKVISNYVATGYNFLTWTLETSSEGMETARISVNPRFLLPGKINTTVYTTRTGIQYIYKYRLNEDDTFSVFMTEKIKIYGEYEKQKFLVNVMDSDLSISSGNTIIKDGRTYVEYGENFFFTYNFNKIAIGRKITNILIDAAGSSNETLDSIDIVFDDEVLQYRNRDSIQSQLTNGVTCDINIKTVFDDIEYKITYIVYGAQNNVANLDTSVVYTITHDLNNVPYSKKYKYGQDEAYKKELLSEDELKEVLRERYDVNTDVIMYSGWHKALTPYSLEGEGFFVDGESMNRGTYQNPRIHEQEVWGYQGPSARPVYYSYLINIYAFTNVYEGVTVKLNPVIMSTDNYKRYFSENHDELAIPDYNVVTGASYPVVEVEDFSFNNTGIKRLHIGKNVTKIGKSAFVGCNKLMAITLSDEGSLKTIEQSAFSGCSNLEKLGIITDAQVKELEQTVLTLPNEMILPDTVETVGAEAFLNCMLVPKLYLGKGLVNVGRSAFAKMSKLEYIYYNSMLPENSRTVDVGIFAQSGSRSGISGTSGGIDFVIGKDVRFVPEGFFSNFSSNEMERGGVYLKNVSFEETEGASGVTIDKNAFFASGIEHFQGSSRLTSLGTSTFQDCVKLEEADLLYTQITIVRESTFRNCVKLKLVMLPDTIKEIGAYAFYACAALESVFYNDDIPTAGISSVGERAFCYDLDMGRLEVRYMSLKRIAPYSVHYEVGTNPESNKDIFLKEVQLIGAQAFYKCGNFSGLYITGTNTTIGREAFFEATGIKTFVYDITNAKDLMGNDYAFNGAGDPTGTRLTITDRVVKIPAYLFDGYKQIENMTLPESITTIGNGAFRTMSRLRNVYFNSIKVTSVFTGESPFFNTEYALSATARVNDIKLIVGNKVQILPEGFFKGIKKLKEADFSNLENADSFELGKNSLSGTSLERVVFPELGALTINDSAFSGDSLSYFELNEKINKVVFNKGSLYTVSFTEDAVARAFGMELFDENHDLIVRVFDGKMTVTRTENGYSETIDKYSGSVDGMLYITGNWMLRRSDELLFVGLYSAMRILDERTLTIAGIFSCDRITLESSANLIGAAYEASTFYEMIRIPSYTGFRIMDDIEFYEYINISPKTSFVVQEGALATFNNGFSLRTRIYEGDSYVTNNQCQLTYLIYEKGAVTVNNDVLLTVNGITPFGSQSGFVVDEGQVKVIPKSNIRVSTTYVLAENAKARIYADPISKLDGSEEFIIDGELTVTCEARLPFIKVNGVLNIETIKENGLIRIIGKLTVIHLNNEETGVMYPEVSSTGVINADISKITLIGAESDLTYYSLIEGPMREGNTTIKEEEFYKFLRDIYRPEDLSIINTNRFDFDEYILDLTEYDENGEVVRDSEGNAVEHTLSVLPGMNFYTANTKIKGKVSVSDGCVGALRGIGYNRNYIRTESGEPAIKCEESEFELKGMEISGNGENTVKFSSLKECIFRVIECKILAPNGSGIKGIGQFNIHYSIVRARDYGIKCESEREYDESYFVIVNIIDTDIRGSEIGFYMQPFVNLNGNADTMKVNIGSIKVEELGIAEETIIDATRNAVYFAGGGDLCMTGNVKLVSRTKGYENATLRLKDSEEKMCGMYVDDGSNVRVINEQHMYEIEEFERSNVENPKGDISITAILYEGYYTDITEGSNIGDYKYVDASRIYYEGGATQAVVAYRENSKILDDISILYFKYDSNSQEMVSEVAVQTETEVKNQTSYYIEGRSELYQGKTLNRFIVDSEFEVDYNSVPEGYDPQNNEDDYDIFYITQKKVQPITYMGTTSYYTYLTKTKDEIKALTYYANNDNIVWLRKSNYELNAFAYNMYHIRGELSLGGNIAGNIVSTVYANVNDDADNYLRVHFMGGVFSGSYEYYRSATRETKVDNKKSFNGEITVEGEEVFTGKLNIIMPISRSDAGSVIGHEDNTWSCIVKENGAIVVRGPYEAIISTGDFVNKGKLDNVIVSATYFSSEGPGNQIVNVKGDIVNTITKKAWFIDTKFTPILNETINILAKKIIIQGVVSNGGDVAINNIGYYDTNGVAFAPGVQMENVDYSETTILHGTKIQLNTLQGYVEQIGGEITVCKANSLLNLVQGFDENGKGQIVFKKYADMVALTQVYSATFEEGVEIFRNGIAVGMLETDDPKNLNHGPVAEFKILGGEFVHNGTGIVTVAPNGRFIIGEKVTKIYGGTDEEYGEFKLEGVILQHGSYFEYMGDKPLNIYENVPDERNPLETEENYPKNKRGVVVYSGAVVALKEGNQTVIGSPLPDGKRILNTVELVKAPVYNEYGELVCNFYAQHTKGWSSTVMFAKTSEGYGVEYKAFITRNGRKVETKATSQIKKVIWEWNIMVGIWEKTGIVYDISDEIGNPIVQDELHLPAHKYNNIPTIEPIPDQPTKHRCGICDYMANHNDSLEKGFIYDWAYLNVNEEKCEYCGMKRGHITWIQATEYNEANSEEPGHVDVQEWWEMVDRHDHTCLSCKHVEVHQPAQIARTYKIVNTVGLSSDNLEFEIITETCRICGMVTDFPKFPNGEYINDFMKDLLAQYGKVIGTGQELEKGNTGDTQKVEVDLYMRSINMYNNGTVEKEYGYVFKKDPDNVNDYLLVGYVANGNNPTIMVYYNGVLQKNVTIDNSLGGSNDILINYANDGVVKIKPGRYDIRFVPDPTATDPSRKGTIVIKEQLFFLYEYRLETVPDPTADPEANPTPTITKYVLYSELMGVSNDPSNTNGDVRVKIGFISNGNNVFRIYDGAKFVITINGATNSSLIGQSTQTINVDGANISVVKLPAGRYNIYYNVVEETITIDVQRFYITEFVGADEVVSRRVELLGNKNDNTRTYIGYITDGNRYIKIFDGKDYYITGGGSIENGFIKLPKGRYKFVYNVTNNSVTITEQVYEIHVYNGNNKVKTYTMSTDPSDAYNRIVTGFIANLNYTFKIYDGNGYNGYIDFKINNGTKAQSQTLSEGKYDLKLILDPDGDLRSVPNPTISETKYIYTINDKDGRHNLTLLTGQLKYKIEKFVSDGVTRFKIFNGISSYYTGISASGSYDVTTDGILLPKGIYDITFDVTTDKISAISKYTYKLFENNTEKGELELILADTIQNSNTYRFVGYIPSNTNRTIYVKDKSNTNKYSSTIANIGKYDIFFNYITNAGEVKEQVFKIVNESGNKELTMEASSNGQIYQYFGVVANTDGEKFYIVDEHRIGQYTVSDGYTTGTDANGRQYVTLAKGRYNFKYNNNSNNAALTIEEQKFYIVESGVVNNAEYEMDGDKADQYRTYVGYNVTTTAGKNIKIFDGKNYYTTNDSGYTVTNNGIKLPKGKYTIIFNVETKTVTIEPQPFSIMEYNKKNTSWSAKNINIKLNGSSDSDIRSAIYSVPTKTYFFIYDGKYYYYPSNTTTVSVNSSISNVSLNSATILGSNTNTKAIEISPGRYNIEFTYIEAASRFLTPSGKITITRQVFTIHEFNGNTKVKEYTMTGNTSSGKEFEYNYSGYIADGVKSIKIWDGERYVQNSYGTDYEVTLSKGQHDIKLEADSNLEYNSATKYYSYSPKGTVTTTFVSRDIKDSFNENTIANMVPTGNGSIYMANGVALDGNTYINIKDSRGVTYVALDDSVTISVESDENGFKFPLGRYNISVDVSSNDPAQYRIKVEVQSYEVHIYDGNTKSSTYTLTANGYERSITNLLIKGTQTIKIHDGISYINGLDRSLGTGRYDIKYNTNTNDYTVTKYAYTIGTASTTKTLADNGSGAYQLIYYVDSNNTNLTFKISGTNKSFKYKNANCTGSNYSISNLAKGKYRITYTFANNMNELDTLTVVQFTYKVTTTESESLNMTISSSNRTYVLNGFVSNGSNRLNIVDSFNTKYINSASTGIIDSSYVESTTTNNGILLKKGRYNIVFNYETDKVTISYIDVKFDINGVTYVPELKIVSTIQNSKEYVYNDYVFKDDGTLSIKAKVDGTEKTNATETSKGEYDITYDCLTNTITATRYVYDLYVGNTNKGAMAFVVNGNNYSYSINANACVINANTDVQVKKGSTVIGSAKTLNQGKYDISVTMTSSKVVTISDTKYEYMISNSGTRYDLSTAAMVFFANEDGTLYEVDTTGSNKTYTIPSPYNHTASGKQYIKLARGEYDISVDYKGVFTITNVSYTVQIGSESAVDLELQSTGATFKKTFTGKEISSSTSIVVKRIGATTTQKKTENVDIGKYDIDISCVVKGAATITATKYHYTITKGTETYTDMSNIEIFVNEDDTLYKIATNGELKEYTSGRKTEIDGEYYLKFNKGIYDISVNYKGVFTIYTVRYKVMIGSTDAKTLETPSNDKVEGSITGKAIDANNTSIAVKRFLTTGNESIVTTQTVNIGKYDISVTCTKGSNGAHASVALNVNPYTYSVELQGSTTTYSFTNGTTGTITIPATKGFRIKCTSPSGTSTYLKTMDSAVKTYVESVTGETVQTTGDYIVLSNSNDLKVKITINLASGTITGIDITNTAEIASNKAYMEMARSMLRMSAPLTAGDPPEYYVQIINGDNMYIYKMKQDGDKFKYYNLVKAGNIYEYLEMWRANEDQIAQYRLNIFKVSADPNPGNYECKLDIINYCNVEVDIKRQYNVYFTPGAAAGSKGTLEVVPDKEIIEFVEEEYSDYYGENVKLKVEIEGDEYYVYEVYDKDNPSSYSYVLTPVHDEWKPISTTQHQCGDKGCSYTEEHDHLGYITKEVTVKNRTYDVIFSVCSKCGYEHDYVIIEEFKKIKDLKTLLYVFSGNVSVESDHVDDDKIGEIVHYVMDPTLKKEIVNLDGIDYYLYKVANFDGKTDHFVLVEIEIHNFARMITELHENEYDVIKLVCTRCGESEYVIIEENTTISELREKLITVGDTGVLDKLSIYQDTHIAYDTPVTYTNEQGIRTKKVLTINGQEYWLFEIETYGCILIRRVTFDLGNN